MGKITLGTRNVSIEFPGVKALSDVNIEVSTGMIHALMGANGAGKTTTIKMLSCLTKPTSGDAFVGEASIVRDELNVKRVIGVSPQETAVAPNLSVKENLELICGIYGFTKKKKQAKTISLYGPMAELQAATRM